MGYFMQTARNERGSVLVFITLMIVVLLLMVGMGLDTGQLTYVRSQGQAAVDAAALAAVSGLRVAGANPTQVEARAAIFNPKNNFVGSKVNQIGATNISYVKYDFASDQITNYSETFANANGVRVALEQATGSGIQTPVYLTPLFNLLGVPTSGTQNVNVSAVAVVTAIPSLPIAIYDTQCTAPQPVKIRATDDPKETGCWTTYFDGSTSKPDVVGLMKASGTCNGTPQGANVGDSIHLNDGNQKPDYDAANDLFTANPSQCWIVPVVAAPSPTAKTNNCNQWQPILDFASICPTTVVSTKNPKYIQATVTCKQTLDATSNNLCFSHRLVREKEAGKAY
jgi:Flp pilus assembly protein TadG